MVDARKLPWPRHASSGQSSPILATPLHDRIHGRAIKAIRGGMEGARRWDAHHAPGSRGLFPRTMPSTTRGRSGPFLRERTAPEAARRQTGDGEAVLGAHSARRCGQWRAGRWAARAGGATAKRSTSGCGEDSRKRASHKQSQADGRMAATTERASIYLWRTVHGFAVALAGSQNAIWRAARRVAREGNGSMRPAAGALEAEGEDCARRGISELA